MTPPPPTPTFPEPDDLDLAASAVIDREQGGDHQHQNDPPQPDRPEPDRAPADPAAAGQAGDPGSSDALAERVARLRPAVAALREPVLPPATSIRDAQVAVALTGAANAAGGADEPHGGPRGPAGPTRLDRRWGRRGRVALAVAAAVLVLVVGAAVVATHASSNRTRTEAAIAGTRPGAPVPDDHGRRPTGAPAAAPSTPAGPDLALTGLPDLGAASDAAGLAALVQRHQVAAPSATGLTAAPGAQVPSAGQSTSQSASTTDVGCEARVRAALGSLGSLSLRARATLAGRPVEVLVFAPGPAARTARLVATDPQTCEVFVDRPS